MKDVIIIGAGPAGVSAALYTARAGLKTMVLSMGNGAKQRLFKITMASQPPLPAKHWQKQGYKVPKMLVLILSKKKLLELAFKIS